MADRAPIDVAAERRLSRAMRWVAWFGAHSAAMAVVSVLAIAAVAVFDGLAPSEWTIASFYMVPLALLAVTFRRRSVVAVVGACCVALTVGSLLVRSNLADSPAHHVFLVFFGLGVVLLIELAGLLEEIDALSRHAVARARFAEADAEIVALSAASGELPQLLTASLERMCLEVGGGAAAILALEGDEWVVLTGFGLPPEFAGHRVPRDKLPLSIELLEEGRPAVFPDAREVLGTIDDPLAQAVVGAGIRDAIKVPMLSSGRELGVLMLGRGERFGAMNDEERRFVVSVAGHLATTIDNARLVAELSARQRHLSLVLDSSLDFAATLDPTKVIEAVVARLVAAVAATGCDVYIVVEPERTSVRTVISYADGEFDTSGYLGHEYGLADLTSTARVIETGRSLVIDDFDDPRLSDEERRFLRKHGQVSLFSVPLKSGERVIGVVELFNTATSWQIGDEEIELAEAMCQFAALALDNAQLFDRVESRNRALHELVEIGRVVSTAPDIDGLLRAVARRLFEVLGVADCDIFTLRGDQLFSAVSFDRDGFDEASTGHTLRVDEYASTQQVIETEQPVVVSAEEVAGLSGTERAVYEEYGFAASASIPMVVEGRVHGIIEVYDDRPRDFRDDLDFLTTAGQLVAAGLQKQILLEQVTARNVALRELVELGAVIWRTRDLDSLVRQAARRLAKATGATCCEIYRLEAGALRCAVSFHERDGFDETGLGRPLRLLEFPATAKAIDSREPLVIAGADDSRLSEKDRAMYAEAGFESELCLPLVIQDRVVGLVDIFDERRRDFSSSLDFVVTAGRMIAGAFDNIDLLGRLNETNRELEALVESGLEFSSTLDLDRVLMAIGTRMRDVTEALRCDIYALEGTTARGLVSIERDGGVDQDFPGQTWDVNQYSLREWLETEPEPMVVSDRQRSEVITDFERAEWESLGYRSALRLPLVSRGRLYGWISIYDDSVREFKHLGFLRGIAQIAAQALVNATLYGELDDSTRRLSLVNEASFDLSSTLSLETVLYATAERLCAVAGVACCDVYRIDVDESLVCVASVKDGAVSLGWVGHTVPLREWGSDAHAVASRATLIMKAADDPQRSAEEIASLEGTGFESQLTVPLLTTDHVLGTVQLLDRRRDRAFAPDTVATVEAICRAAALAVSNAELFAVERDTSRRLERLAAQLLSLQEITMGLNRLRGEHRVLEEVVKGGAELLAVDRAAYAIRDGEVVQLKAFYSAAGDWRCSEEEAEAVLDTLRAVLPRLSDFDRTPGVEAPMEQRAIVCGDSLVVPLRRHRSDAVAALIFSEKLEGGGFGDEDSRLATTLAAQLSATLRNVHAYLREHEIAEEFQDALLEPAPMMPGVDLGVRYVPAGEAARVGGDFYDFVRLGPQRFMVAVGDVCGRGLTAAVQTAMVRYMLRAYAAESSPGESLARLNATIAAQAPELPFLTMLVAYVDVARHAFDYAVAGHPRPIVFAGGERLAIAEAGSFPVGVFPNSVYPTNHCVLPAAATAVVYTDGLTEARRDGALLRDDRVARLIGRRLDLPAQELAEHLVAVSRRFGGEPLDDDMAVVVVKLP